MSRNENRPSREQLQKLYQAAIAFKKAEPWNSFHDTDLIAVQNPQTEMIGYCSIMGRAGEHYALGVYLDTPGLAGFHELMNQGKDIPRTQILHYHDCVMCSFEDREYLAKEDRSDIKDLGLSFRGREAWPLFRRYEPGFYPWFINEEECVFLTHCLVQILIVTDLVRTGRMTIDLEQGITILRSCNNDKDKLEWKNEPFQLNFPKSSWRMLVMDDEMLISRIKNSDRLNQTVLLAEVNYSLSPVQDRKGSRPYFPRLFFLIDKETSQIIEFEMFIDIKEDAKVVLEKTINFCLQHGIPAEVRVSGDKMAAILKDFCIKAGIRLRRVKRLALIDRIIEDMSNFPEMKG